MSPNDQEPTAETRQELVEARAVGDARLPTAGSGHFDRAAIVWQRSITWRSNSPWVALLMLPVALVVGLIVFLLFLLLALLGVVVALFGRGLRFGSHRGSGSVVAK